MKFEIGFNRRDNNDTKEFYKFIEATLISKEECEYYQIELNTFEELEQLLEKINGKIAPRFLYSAVVSFDPPTIYIDKEV